MIKIKVEEYCNDCPEFEPEAIKPQPIYDSIGNYVGMLGPMVVVCAHRNTCRRFMEYLQKSVVKERGERNENKSNENK